MKKLILLLILGGLLYGGYTFYSSPNGQAAIEKTKLAKFGYDVVNENDPAKVLALVAENEATVNVMVERQLITEEQVAEFKTMLEEMQANGEPVDKQVLAEKYIKGKVPLEKYQQILDLVTKENLGLEDIQTVIQIFEEK